MKSPRVELVEVDAQEHARLLFEWRLMPEIAEFMYSRKPLKWESHLEWIHSLPANQHRCDFVVKLDQNPVGSVYLTAIDGENRRCEFGMYVADGRARVQGVGAAAEYLVLDHAFADLGMHKVSCEVFETNTAPISMHSRFGFKTEGTLRQHVATQDGWTDVVRMSLLSEEWSVAKSKMFHLLCRLLQTD